VVVGLDVPPAGSTVIPIRSPGSTPEASTGPARPAPDSSPAERAASGPIMDGRDALLAVGMNGQPLPVEHGFPARMVVPSLYGYTSATKWVTRLTVTTFAAQRAYWTQRGYAAVAPIHTESRIDAPKPLAQVAAGQVTVAGVAWAPATGIAAVQVSVDNGPWQTARLAAVDGFDTWRQWVWTWDAAPGLHTLRVRGVRQDPGRDAEQRAVQQGRTDQDPHLPRGRRALHPDPARRGRPAQDAGRRHRHPA